PEGEAVARRGQVSNRPLSTGEVNSYYLPIQDEAEYGFLLQGDVSLFNGLNAGDWIEAAGVVGRHAGMPVLFPHEIRVTGHAAVPRAKQLRVQALNSFRYLGLLVTTQSRISVPAEESGGDLVTLADWDSRIRAFLALVRRPDEARRSPLQQYRTGDLVRVTGIAAQHCMLPPYDHSYQVVLPGPSSLVLLEKAWMFSPSMILVAGLVIMVVLGLLSLRERYILKQRRTLRGLNVVGEEVIGSALPAEIVRKLI